MFRSIAVAFIIVIAAIALIAATRPAALGMERSTRISSPRENIFHYVNDLHQWGVWSPYLTP